MAVFEGSHGNILQGVSQQIPRSRLEGQVSEQVNMISDPVTGIRRRQGCKYRTTLKSDGVKVDVIKAWRVELGGSKVEFILDSSKGSVHIYENGLFKVTLSNDYLKTPLISNIKHTTVGESVYILNTSKVPQGVSSTQDNGTAVGQSGFANFLTGALNREFTTSVRITKPNGAVVEIVGRYTTPDGSSPSHVNQITPEHIAGKIYESLQSQITSQSLGTHIILARANATIVAKAKDTSRVRVLANAGELYVVTSNLGNISDVGKLPDRMPDGVNGVTYSVGKDKSLRYYTFNQSRGAWVETSGGGFTGINTMPIEVYYDVDTSAWKLNASNFVGRLAGDEDNNPDPDFVGWGITGISSYQGRLVLLSGSYVWLSASGKPRLFYRTTLEELLDTDPIGIGSSSATSASFQYAVNFNKDLILFSTEHQALIAGGNTPITPKNANIMLTSTYTADMSVEPVSLGRSMMYPMPRSTKYYGVMEMIPSPYTDSAYISTDVTEHIPTYLAGRCRIAVSSTVGSIVLMGSTECLKTLYVHEYVWEGDEKLLKAWHKWTFEIDIADVYFNGDLISIVFVNGGYITKCSIDPRSQALDTPDIFIDYHITKDKSKLVSTNTQYKEYREFLKTSNIKVVHALGGLTGSEVGFNDTLEGIELTSSTEASTFVVGVPYRSEIHPSPPIVRDQEGIPISTNRLNLINYYCTTDNSGEYTITVKDKARASLDLEYDRSPVQWLSTELSLGKTPIGGLSGDVIPCRVPADSSTVVFSTEGVKELNIIALEYVVKYNYRRQRR